MTISSSLSFSIPLEDKPLQQTVHNYQVEQGGTQLLELTPPSPQMKPAQWNYDGDSDDGDGIESWHSLQHEWNLQSWMVLMMVIVMVLLVLRVSTAFTPHETRKATGWMNYWSPCPLFSEKLTKSLTSVPSPVIVECSTTRINENLSSFLTLPICITQIEAQVPAWASLSTQSRPPF